MKQASSRDLRRGITVAVAIAVSWLVLGLIFDASPTYIVGGMIGALTAPVALVILGRKRQRR